MPAAAPAAREESPASEGVAAGGFGIATVDVRGFRSALEVSFAPGPLCALVGEANVGKSNLLAAIRTALDPAGAPLTAGDATAGGDGSISIRVGSSRAISPARTHRIGRSPCRPR
jgi:hypothetical protein